MSLLASSEGQIHSTNDSNKTIAIAPIKAHGQFHARFPRHISLLVTTRTRRETVTFKNPAQIRGVGRLLPAGTYDVVTDEEMIEGLSFPCYRRVATMIMVPGIAPHQLTSEMISIGSVDLADAQRIDATSPGISPHEDKS